MQRNFERVKGPARTAARWGAMEALVASLGLSAFVYLVVQRAGFDELLGLSRLRLQGDEPWLVPTTVLSTSLLTFSPAVIVAVALQRCALPRASRASFVGLSSLALFLLMLDLDLLRSFGRHLSEVVRVALQPQGHVAGGDPLQWGRTLAGWGLLAVLASWGAMLAAQRVVQPLARRSSPLLRRGLGGALGALLVGLLTLPHLNHGGWRNAGLYERMYGALLLDPRVGIAAAVAAEPVDPVLRQLAPRLRRAYADAFPALAIGEAGTNGALSLPPRRPNVILIVTESLRHDVFGPELMPRLSGWAENGLTALEHDAGTNYSQSALFALLYGRSPFLYHQTLNAHVPPQLCVTLRASGYECAYFTGHPKVWQRREEFVNPETMDHFVHDDRGTWPEWDGRALESMVELVTHSEKPIFAIVLLMSSHFEYRYPAKYEIDRPVASSVWNVTPVRALGAEAQTPHRNRYRNCMRFIDDVVADAIARLDPARNLVVFTGDHGESINDDGRYTHGYSFAEIITRTPFAMVGPGVAKGKLERPTYHADVLPTLLHVLSGSHVSIPHVQGSDWLEDPEPSAALLAYAPPSEYEIQAQLRTSGLRLRLDFDARAPQITLLGFEDGLGHLAPTPPLTEQMQDGLVRAFEEQLQGLRR